jgi:hypothetical protein
MDGRYDGDPLNKEIDGAYGSNHLPKGKSNCRLTVNG